MIRLITMFLVTYTCVGSAQATSLYDPSSYRSFVADHRAHSVGETVTLLIYENSEAQSDSDSAADRRVSASVDYDSDSKLSFAHLGLDFSDNGSRGTQRSGRLRAQITAVVESVDPAGKLYVAGRQEIVVNGDKQIIAIKGWLRPEDVTPTNTALSTRLSDAHIEYVGDHLDGFEGGGGLIQKAADVVLWIPRKVIDLTSWLLGVL